MFVIKRDGRKQQFNSNKIINAVQSAFEKVDGEITKQATDKSKEIAKYIETMNKIMTVEEIQDIVENKLMASSRKDVGPNEKTASLTNVTVSITLKDGTVYEYYELQRKGFVETDSVFDGPKVDEYVLFDIMLEASTYE